MAAYTTIDNPELYFQCKIWTGTGSSNALTLDGDENMQPDFVWVKRRNSAGGHMLTDVIRGVTKTIITNETGAEQTFTNGLTGQGKMYAMSPRRDITNQMQTVYLIQSGFKPWFLNLIILLWVLLLVQLL